MLYQLKVEGD